MAINKEKSMNYVVSGVVLLVAVMLINKLAFSLWRFDMFNLKHYSAFAKFVASGRIFNSPKYLSFFMVMVGSLMVSYFLVVESFDLDLSKYFKKNGSVSEKDETQKEIAKEQEVVKEEVSPAKLIEDEKIASYNVYNQPSEVVDIPVQNEVPQLQEIEEVAVQPNQIDEEKEREKLQSKIREVMEKLKTKSLDEAVQEAEKVEEVKEEEMSQDKILTSVQFDEKQSLTDMNFKNISEEQNLKIEEVFVSAGFKLLSEIRIGKTGIDYLGVAKDGITILQLDTKAGNWMASEDRIDDELPVWFSEEERKYSPVARAIEARDTIAELIDGKVDLPIKAYACLANSSVMNFFDIEDEWKRNEVEVLRLSSNQTIDDIDTLEEKFAPSSVEEVDAKVMDTLIEILEKAELPE